MSGKCWKTRIADSSAKLPVWRREVLSLAIEMGFAQQDARDIALAVFEACANAVHHSDKDGSGWVTLRVRSLKDRFEATVEDDGGGMRCAIRDKMPPPQSLRGRGIPLMQAIMDEVRFVSNGGCKVTLVKHLKH